MARRRYSHEDIAATLATLKATGDNVAETARATGISESNIRRWRDNPEPEAADMVAEKEADLKTLLERGANALAGSILDKIDGASLNHVAVALGIVVDKLRLLSGEATEVTEVRGSDAKRELAERLARLASERSEAPRAPN